MHQIGSAPGVRSFKFTATLLFSILLITLLAQVPTSLVPGWLRGQHLTYSAVWPQAWTFFADAPITDMVAVYRVEEGDTMLSSRNSLSLTYMSSDNLLGLSHRAGTQIVEINFLAEQIPAQFWSPCTQQSSDGCGAAIRNAHVYALSNTFQTPTLCGEVAFVVERPRPAVSSNNDGGAAWRPMKAAVTRLSCSG